MDERITVSVFQINLGFEGLIGGPLYDSRSAGSFKIMRPFRNFIKDFEVTDYFGLVTWHAQHKMVCLEQWKIRLNFLNNIPFKFFLYPFTKVDRVALIEDGGFERLLAHTHYKSVI